MQLPWAQIQPVNCFVGSQKDDARKPNFDSNARADEGPVHEVSLSEYAIGRYPVTVHEFAQFIESGGYKRLDKLIVVYCEPEIQLQRLINRDGLSPEAAQTRISAQMPQEEKIKYADFLIDASGDFAGTRAQVETLFEQLRNASTNNQEIIDAAGGSC